MPKCASSLAISTPSERLRFRVAASPSRIGLRGWTEIASTRFGVGDPPDRGIGRYIKDGSMLDLNLDQSLVLEIGDRLTSNISAYLFDAAQDAM